MNKKVKDIKLIIFTVAVVVLIFDVNFFTALTGALIGEYISEKFFK